MKFSKNNPSISNLIRFYQYFKPYRLRALGAIVFTVILGMLGGVTPALLQVYIDGVAMPDQKVMSVSVLMEKGTEAEREAVSEQEKTSEEDGNTDEETTGSKVKKWIAPFFSSAFFPLLVIAFALVESGFSFASNYLTIWVGRHVANDVKIALFRKLLRSDPALFDKYTSGTILIRYSGDADAASEQLLSNSKTLLTRIVTSVFLVAVMLYYSWQLAAVAVGSLLVTVVPISLVRRKLKAYINEAVKIGAIAGTNYFETYSGNRVIISYNLFDYIEKRLDTTLKNLFRLSIKMTQRTNSLSLVMHGATSLGIAATLWMHGYLSKKGELSFGDFVACITSLIMLYTPIKKMGSTFASIQSCEMAIARVMEVLDIEPAIQSRPDAKLFSGLNTAICYNGVDFSYEPGKPVLKNIDLEIRAGQSVAFVGNSGGGKTTLANLLPRFYDVDSGSVTIDGVDVRDMNLFDLRDNIAIVFQDNFLFGGTIRTNILLGNLDATEEDIARAVKAACLDEFIGSLRHGLDTEIGERGVMLSGGQKQRIAIARAFIKDAPIVILDEATSALDNKSEVVVQQAIENLMQNKTVLIIAHRLSTVINSDRIVVIRDGALVESGTHKELMSNPDGVYSSLYKTQLV